MSGSTSTYEQLRAAFENRRFAPLYLFYGEERYLMVELQGLLIQHALQPHERDFNLDIVYGPESDAPDALARCTGFPMMAERRVVIIREFDKLPDNRLFAAYAESPNPHAVVVLVAGEKPNFSAHPFRALRAHSAVCEFKRLDSRALPPWVRARAREQGCEMEARAAQILADLVGGELADLAAEVDKLVTYVADRKRVTAGDVVEASGQSREHNVFELQRAVAGGRHADALRIAERLLQQSSNPQGEALRVLNTLGRFFMKLWLVAGAKSQGASDKELAEIANVAAYYLKEYTGALARYGSRELEAAFSALLAADFELKGGSARDERLILRLMLGRILRYETSARAA